MNMEGMVKQILTAGQAAPTDRQVLESWAARIEAAAGVPELKSEAARTLALAHAVTLIYAAKDLREAAKNLPE